MYTLSKSHIVDTLQHLFGEYILLEQLKTAVACTLLIHMDQNQNEVIKQERWMCYSTYVSKQVQL